MLRAEDVLLSGTPCHDPVAIRLHLEMCSLAQWSECCSDHDTLSLIDNQIALMSPGFNKWPIQRTTLQPTVHTDAGKLFKERIDHLIAQGVPFRYMDDIVNAWQELHRRIKFRIQVLDLDRQQAHMITALHEQKTVLHKDAAASAYAHRCIAGKYIPILWLEPPSSSRDNFCEAAQQRA